MCNLCGNITNGKVIKSSISSVYSRSRGQLYKIIECSECKVLQTFPFPTELELLEIYSNDYSYEYHDAVFVEKSNRAKSILKLILRHAPTDEILEFGSGSGVLLNEAYKLGLKVTGVELSEKAGNVLSIGSDVKLVNDSAENFLMSATSLPDTIVLSHTLEHFLKPEELLSNIYDKLPWQGTLVLVVPNNRNILRKFRSRYWGYWQVPVHTYHFNHGSLKSLLLKTGFIPKRTFYRSGDFLSKGLFVTNLLNISSSKLPGRELMWLVKVLSSLWFLAYKFGRSDLILIAKKSS
jgi:2-polyprenyl-3-methyl-5-hydroxy-6-metoxy-1,4-benzoquinol methylase